MSRTRSVALLCAFLTLLNDRIGESMVFPLLTFLVAPLVDTRHVGLVVGLLGGSYAAFQFLATPVIGSLSDHFGRRPVLTLCIIGTALSVGLFGLGAVLGASLTTGSGAFLDLALMFAGRSLHGVAGGTAATAQAVIVDVTPPAKRAQALGLVGVAIGLGFIIGPGWGSWLMDVHLALPIAMAVAFALLNLLLTLWFFSETLPGSARQPSLGLGAFNPFWNMIQTLGNPRVGRLSVGFGLFFIVLYSCVTILVPFVTLELSWQATDVGQAFALLGMGSIAVQGLLLGPLSRWLGAQRLVPIGIGLMLLGCLMVSLARPDATALDAAMGKPLVNSAVVMWAMGVGLLVPSLRALISQRLAAGSQGKAMGSVQALQSLGASVGPATAGILFSYLTPRAPFLIAVLILLLVGGLIIGPLVRQRQLTSSPP
ncbi:MAG: TCR/Tet family MFS transporter [Synechococcus sp. SB0668_bin_15]|nr:TCR/Tet family MFS transporter [Synechococcus sp. SB0668_bin_15]